MTRKNNGPSGNGSNGQGISASVDELLLAAQERGGDGLETGRYVITYKEGAGDEAARSLSSFGLRVADARDFEDQAVTLENVGAADALVFPEIGAAVVDGRSFEQRGLGVEALESSDSPILAVEPEYFVFSQQDSDVYLLGFRRAVETISHDLRTHESGTAEAEEDVLVGGATWGLIKCRVPLSVRSGAGIRVAVLDTGMDLGHPEFAGRSFTTKSFVGQPVQDLHGHGTHTTGTACGPKAPAGAVPRYGIGYKSLIYVGKVLSNSGSGSTASVLAGMNWAIANKCAVISMSLGSAAPVQAAYTAAGAAALSKGCLIIAAAGNTGLQTGSPANSPTIMAVASLDQNLAPSVFSCHGKIEIAAPGRDVFSSAPRPKLHAIMSGTSMATPHVAGCAALWAETSPGLRGAALWKKLQASAKHLPYPASRVGAGLVQAP